MTRSRFVGNRVNDHPGPPNSGGGGKRLQVLGFDGARTRHGRVDPRERAGAPGRPIHDQRQPNRAWTDLLQYSHILGPMETPAPHRDLANRLANFGIEGASLEGHRRAGRVESGRPVELEGLPGAQSLLREFREAGRVAGRSEGLLGRPAGGLVLAVTVTGGPGEDRHHDLGPEPADDPNHVLQDRVLGPKAERLGQVLRKPEIKGPGEVLPSSVEPAGGQQLLGPDQAERLTEFGADQVLATLSTGQRELGGNGPFPPNQEGE